MAQIAGLFRDIKSRFSFSIDLRYQVLLVSLLAFAVYAATLSHNYSDDSFYNALAVESGNPKLMTKFSHLLVHPLGWAFYHLWRFLGWTGSAMLPLQVLNALGGALCVGFVCAIARRFAGSSRAAAMVALGFAFSGGTWLLSTEAEFVTVPLAFKLFILWLLLAVDTRRMSRPAYALQLGLGTVVAMLFYLNSAFLVPVILVCLLSKKEMPVAVRRIQVIRVLSILFLFFIAAGILMVAFLWIGGDRPNLWASIGGDKYGTWSLFNLAHGSYAFLRSIALYANLGMNDRTSVYLADAEAVKRLLFFGYYTVVLALASFPLILTAMRLKRWWPARSSQIGVLAIWTVLYAAFAFYWVPGDFSFWMPVLAAWWFLVALGFSVIESKKKYLVFLASAVIFLLAVNALFLILPHSYNLWTKQNRVVIESVEVIPVCPEDKDQH